MIRLGRDMDVPGLAQASLPRRFLVVLRLLAAAAFATLLLCPGAEAGTVVIFGDKVVVRHTGPDVSQLEKTGLSYCSERDEHCKVLTRCDGNGYGALVVSRINRHVDSIGATCGKVSDQEAKDEATRLCSQNAKYGQCAIEQVWVEQ